jgi:hypothetical protein
MLGLNFGVPRPLCGLLRSEDRLLGLFRVLIQVHRLRSL